MVIRKGCDAMSIGYTGIVSVDKLYGLPITGNIVPSVWCHEIIGENGKPNMNAVMILAEIVYWYRPKVEKTEEEQNDIQLQKKFKADLLQLSYRKIMNKFNLSKDQCKRALDLLENMGLIKRHYRMITADDGTKFNNVMYIELIAEKVIELTCDETHDPGVIEPHRVRDEMHEGHVNIHTPGMLEHMTNTENTTENTNKDYPSIYQDELEKVRKQVDYDCLIIDRKKDKEIIDNLIDLAAEVNLSTRDSYIINGEPLPPVQIKQRLSRIDMDIMKSILDKIKTVNKPVTNVKAYLLTTMYNAPATFETELDMQVRQDMYGMEARA